MDNINSFPYVYLPRKLLDFRPFMLASQFATRLTRLPNPVNKPLLSRSGTHGLRRHAFLLPLNNPLPITLLSRLLMLSSSGLILQKFAKCNVLLSTYYHTTLCTPALNGDSFIVRNTQVQTNM